MGKKYHVNRREFINQFTDMRGHIIAVVEDTADISQDDVNAWKWSQIKLMLGDCDRNIEFAFLLCDAEERENSLHKIRLIAEIVNEVRDAIEIEAALIAERQSVIPLTKSASTVH